MPSDGGAAPPSPAPAPRAGPGPAPGPAQPGGPAAAWFFVYLGISLVYPDIFGYTLDIFSYILVYLDIFGYTLKG